MGRVKTVQLSTGTSAGTVTGIDGTATAKSADYTVTDTDLIRTVLMTTGASTRTVTLPTAADNTNRIITIKKVDSGAGTCIVDGEGSETIDQVTTFTLYCDDESVTVQCDGTGWHILNHIPGKWMSFTPTGTWIANSTYTGGFLRYRSELAFWVKIALSGAPTSATLTINLPTGFTIDTTGIDADSDQYNMGQGSIRQGANSLFFTVRYSSTTVVQPLWMSVSGANVITNAVTQASPGTFASGDEIHLSSRVAITQV